jgi:hypothetical protein
MYEAHEQSRVIANRRIGHPLLPPLVGCAEAHVLLCVFGHAASRGESAEAGIAGSAKRKAPRWVQAPGPALTAKEVHYEAVQTMPSGRGDAF